jgi:TldD protein
MPITRRDFLKTSASAATLIVVAGAPRPLWADLGGRRLEPVPLIDDPRIEALAARALEAARAAGAVYADVRLTHTWIRFIAGVIIDDEVISVGMRALVNGYWGFASSPLWSPDEMARLGREAVHQAKANALGKPRLVELAPVPAVAKGHWVMPVKIDGFDVSPLEVRDYLESLAMLTQRIPEVKPRERSCRFIKQEKAFASTIGTFCSQRTYRTEGQVEVEMAKDERKEVLGLQALSPAGVGWEMFRDQPLREDIRRLVEDLKEDLKLPVKPVDVGRYDTIFDAASMAALVDGTLARATELDRALGYEANDGGTSYLNDPFGMLGNYQAGAPSVTLTADRSEPGGCATVKWDDEGVTPDEFALVKDGVLTDFQTTRESAGWLKDYYAKAAKPLRSHGCASAREGLDAPLQRAPNLTLAPGRDALDFDALVSGLARGIAVKGAEFEMDFQHLNGLALGRTYEIKNGKRIALIAGAGLLFRSSDVWKSILALGGKASMHRFGMSSTKGEPAQDHYASVTAVPATCKQLTLIDALRKA